MKRLVTVLVLVNAAVALAMPTKDELKKAQPLVAELMAPALKEFKESGAKDKAAAAVKVGDTSSEFAKAAETEAARFLLLKGAVNFYTRGEAYDKAADAVAALQTTVKDVAPAVIAEITGKATSKISETKAPRLFALYRTAKLQVRAASEAKSLALKLKRVKSDAIQRRYAEALAVSGDWKAAYCEFAKLSDAKLKAVVEAEAEGKAKNVESGEFWWAYEPEMEDSADFFKSHAAAFYRKALAVGEITGLKKNIVEQRIKPYGESAEVASGGVGTETSLSSSTPATNGLYCVIDLSGGSDAKKYPVSYLNDMPKGGWSDEYKTTKLVLRRIEPGAFMMGSGNDRHSEKIDKAYYLGVFEVTQKQWELVMRNRPSFFSGSSWRLRPVDQISYDTIRGKQEGAKWPASDAVDSDSFMGVVRQKTGMSFDLPTRSQWEYACRAGTKTDFYNGKTCVNDEHDSSLDGLARYSHTGGWSETWGANNKKSRWDGLWKAPDRNCEATSGTATVGVYQPNNWGLYDMLGNVREWCLQEGEKGINLGGCWIDGADACKVYSVNQIAKHRGRHDFGFRLCLPLAGGAAVPASNNSTPKIVGVSPANGDQAVDAGVGEVVVRFDRPMQSGMSLTGFDWPKIAVGEPKWDATMTTLKVMVKLSPKTTYRLGLNSRSHMNFKSKEGLPLAPYTHVFRTK